MTVVMASDQETLMVSRKEWYSRVNSEWPEKLPDLTADEAVRAAKKMYRYGTGQTFYGAVKVTSGNRYTGMRYGVLYVNPDRGWHHLVHDMSHYTYWAVNREGGHSKDHAKLELRMRKVAVRRGWLNGSLKTPDKPKVEIDVKAVRYKRTLASIARWQSKLKRAENALKKLAAKQRNYERSMEAPQQ